MTKPVLTVSALTLLGLTSSILGSPDTEASQSAPAQTEKTPDKSPSPQKPLVKKLTDDTYQIGLITFSKKTREITIPSQTNIIDPGTPLEYVLTHGNGEKIHESLLVTEADPTHLNLALKLLNFKESQELYRPLAADNTREEHFPVVADDIRKAARFTIHLKWKSGSENKSAPVTRWLQHRVTSKPMKDTPWVYNGSYILNNRFKAKITGNFFAIFPDEGAIASYPGSDREDDTLWVPADKLPRTGSKVTLTIKPWSGKLLPQHTQIPQ